jgi:uncharacterized protein with HEPN domain
MRTDRLRLLDAIEQIELVSRFAERGREAFFGDVLVQSAILHRLALLGEACRAVSAEVREAHPEIPWPQIIAFRNVVVHQYFGVDLDLVWVIVTDNISALRTQLHSVADSIPGTV